MNRCDTSSSFPIVEIKIDNNYHGDPLVPLENHWRWTPASSLSNARCPRRESSTSKVSCFRKNRWYEPIDITKKIPSQQLPKRPIRRPSFDDDAIDTCNVARLAVPPRSNNLTHRTPTGQSQVTQQLPIRGDSNTISFSSKDTSVSFASLPQDMPLPEVLLRQASSNANVECWTACTA